MDCDARSPARDFVLRSHGGRKPVQFSGSRHRPIQEAQHEEDPVDEGSRFCLAGEISRPDRAKRPSPGAIQGLHPAQSARMETMTGGPFRCFRSLEPPIAPRQDRRDAPVPNHQTCRDHCGRGVSFPATTKSPDRAGGGRPGVSRIARVGAFRTARGIPGSPNLPRPRSSDIHSPAPNFDFPPARTIAGGHGERRPDGGGFGRFGGSGLGRLYGPAVARWNGRGYGTAVYGPVVARWNGRGCVGPKSIAPTRLPVANNAQYATCSSPVASRLPQSVTSDG